MSSIEQHYEDMSSAVSDGTQRPPTAWGRVTHALAWVRDAAAGKTERAEYLETRALLDTLAFHEVLPMLEARSRHLSYLTGLRKMRCPLGNRHFEEVQRRHQETLPQLLEQIEKATLGIHARRHHQIRDMLENVVLYDDFVNDIYIRNLCGLMRDAIAAHRGASN